MSNAPIVMGERSACGKMATMCRRSRLRRKTSSVYIYLWFSSSAVQQSLADRPPLAAPWQPTQPSKQKNKKNAVGVRSGWPQKQVQPASETTKKTFTSTPSQHKQTHHNRTKTKPGKSRQNRQKSRKTKSCYDSCHSERRLRHNF